MSVRIVKFYASVLKESLLNKGFLDYLASYFDTFAFVVVFVWVPLG